VDPAIDSSSAWVKLIFSGTLFIVRECSDNRFYAAVKWPPARGFPDLANKFPDDLPDRATCSAPHTPGKARLFDDGTRRKFR
jgi:hypothetical protein